MTLSDGSGKQQVETYSPRQRISSQLLAPIGQGRALPDVLAWLAGQPTVAASLVWENATGVASLPAWSSAQQADLVAMFARAWNGTASGLVDPPPNTQFPADDSLPYTTLDATTSWKLYSALVGWSLAVELSGSLSWSVTTYDAEALALLFDARQTFAYARAPNAYYFDFDQGATVPAPPDVALQFLAQNSLVSLSALDSIAWLIDWAHHNLIHFTGALNTLNMEQQWQYRGYPPLSRVLAGTPYTGNPSDGIRHRTAGCHGTAGVFHSLLRLINIPARKLPLQGHALIHFPTEGRYLTHGDDPYDRAWPSLHPVTPASALLIDQAHFHQWFEATSGLSKLDLGLHDKPNIAQSLDAKQLANIGRQPRELALQNLSNYLLNEYCSDLSHGLSHSAGATLAFFKGLCGQAELEARGLWTRLDAKLAALGGCGKVPPA